MDSGEDIDMEAELYLLAFLWVFGGRCLHCIALQCIASLRKSDGWLACFMLGTWCLRGSMGPIACAYACYRRT